MGLLPLLLRVHLRLLLLLSPRDSSSLLVLLLLLMLLQLVACAAVTHDAAATCGPADAACVAVAVWLGSGLAVAS